MESFMDFIHITITIIAGIGIIGIIIGLIIIIIMEICSYKNKPYKTLDFYSKLKQISYILMYFKEIITHNLECSYKNLLYSNLLVTYIYSL